MDLNKYVLVGEAGPELVIPLSGKSKPLLLPWITLHPKTDPSLVKALWKTTRWWWRTRHSSLKP